MKPHSEAQQQFRSCLSRPTSLVRTFSQGAIVLLSPAVMGGSCQANLGRSVTRRTTGENMTPQEKSYFGNTVNPPLQPLFQYWGHFFWRPRVFVALMSLRSSCTKLAAASDVRSMARAQVTPRCFHPYSWSTTRSRLQLVCQVKSQCHLVVKFNTTISFKKSQ